jgi:hypothetical protein
MTLAELCFVIVAILFTVDALPLLGKVTPIKFMQAGLALVAFGLALGLGLAESLGVTGKII